jgi:hypothetical protein
VYDAKRLSAEFLIYYRAMPCYAALERNEDLQSLAAKATDSIAGSNDIEENPLDQ